MKNKKVWIYIGIFLIVALGFFLRIYHINTVPPGIYPDEAFNGLDAINANTTGNYQWFYDGNGGREGLMMNLVAFCFKLFGITVLTLKFPSIISGTLAILGIFLLVRELFNARAGLISAFLVAVSFWPINFSRISFRANLLPTVLVFSFYFLFLGLRTKKWYFYAIGGFIFGIGMHTYIAWRIAPLILILLLVFVILSRKKFLKENWKLITIFLFSSLVAAAPMFWTFYIHPEYIVSRSDSISIFSPKMNNGHLIITFFRTIGLSLAKYNFWGDQNWRDNYPPYPILDTLTGIAFLFGLILSLVKFFKLFYQRIRYKIKNSNLEVYALLILWFFLMLAPEFMTNEMLPHALRSIGTLPVVFIFATVIFDYLIEQGKKHNQFSQKLILALVILSLVFIGLFNTIKYHVFWANKTETARSFGNTIMDVSRYIKSLSPDTVKIIITRDWSQRYERLPLQVINVDDKNIIYLYSAEIDQINPAKIGKFVIIFINYDAETINKLLNNHPGLKFQEVPDKFGLKYYILK